MLRFRLRTLIAVVAISALALAWIASWELSARSRRNVLAAVRERKGRCTWDMQSTTYGFSRWRPKWLVGMLGYEYFDQGLSVELPNATDDDIELLANVEFIRVLILKNSQITDDGLRPLTRLQNLEHLLLDSPTVKQLSPLSQLTNLENLILGKVRWERSSASHLCSLPKLKWLVVEASEFNNDSLASLTGMQQLEALDFNGTMVTVDGAAQFSNHLPRCHIFLRPTPWLTTAKPAFRPQSSKYFGPQSAAD